MYKWVQEYDPALFRRIVKLVKQGKWHIMGGWYLQPDCNMPSGESLIRQILEGKSYFKKHFNVEPETAINFDPFGHSQGLVQILAKTGYHSYLFGRPKQADCPLPNDGRLFIWEGFDGSRVMASRAWPYSSPFGKADVKIKNWLEQHPDDRSGIILWGVGNHGGGPSRLDIKRVNALIKKTKDTQILHSTPETFFDSMSRMNRNIPEHKADLNPCMVGCYTSQIRIKQAHRQLENELYSLEKMVCAAAFQGLMKYPFEQIQEVTYDLLMCQFHDILPGTSIEPAERYALRLIDHGLEIASRLKTRTFFILASDQGKAKNGQIPIMVYNHHPYNVTCTLECEFNLPDFRSPETFTDIIVRHKGKKLPAQVEKELSNFTCDWRKRVVFRAELAASSMNRFDCRLKVIDRKPAIKLKPANKKIVFQTQDIKVVINTETGLIDRYRAGGVESISGSAFEPRVMHDNEDPWAMYNDSFSKIAGRFKLMTPKACAEFSGVCLPRLLPVRVIEDGPVRSVIEALFSYKRSVICQRYKLPKIGTEIEIETIVYWNEKNRMLKLSIPLADEQPVILGQVPFGVKRFTAEGKESAAQKWVAAVYEKQDTAFTCINDSIYGFDFSENRLNLSLLRSAAYGGHPDNYGNVHIPKDRYSPRIDQGRRVFKFWINAGKAEQRLKMIEREAIERNENPYILSFFPEKTEKTVKPFALLNDDAVIVSAMKRSRQGSDLIIRLFEPTGKSRKAVLRLPVLDNKRIALKFKPFEIIALRINPKTKVVKKTNLLEKDETEII